jgi:peptidoglycan hydrolase CwlO-like protein
MGFTVEQEAIQDNAKTKINIYKSKIAVLENLIADEQKKLKPKLKIKSVLRSEPSGDMD